MGWLYVTSYLWRQTNNYDTKRGLFLWRKEKRGPYKAMITRVFHKCSSFSLHITYCFLGCLEVVGNFKVVGVMTFYLFYSMSGLPTATTCPCSDSSCLLVPTPWLSQTLGGLLFTLQPGGTVPPVWRLCSTWPQSTVPHMVDKLLFIWLVNQTTGRRWSCSWHIQT